MADRQHIIDASSLYEGVSFNNVHIDLSSPLWKKPKTLSLENLNGILNIKMNEDVKERNVTSIEYNNQRDNNKMVPEGVKVNERTYISNDENYLYIWVESLKKWKRIILSDWN